MDIVDGHSIVRPGQGQDSSQDGLPSDKQATFCNGEKGVVLLEAPGGARCWRETRFRVPLLHVLALAGVVSMEE